MGIEMKIFGPLFLYQNTGLHVLGLRGKLCGTASKLYNLENDRAEGNNIAEKYLDIVKDLERKWQNWADTHKVFPKGRNDFK